jgi:D-alanyl-D-alanine carboxypeptidase (penicillin-binding protein 5/6)
MVNHNELLKTVKGCDGLKTGFFYAAGFSIAATAARDNKRAIAVVMGSESQRVRDKKAKEMLTEGLSELVRSVPPFAPASPVADSQDRGGNK